VTVPLYIAQCFSQTFRATVIQAQASQLCIGVSLSATNAVRNSSAGSGLAGLDYRDGAFEGSFASIVFSAADNKPSEE
jgi:hypothetical protein